MSTRLKGKKGEENGAYPSSVCKPAFTLNGNYSKFQSIVRNSVMRHLKLISKTSS